MSLRSGRSVNQRPFPDQLDTQNFPLYVQPRDRLIDLGSATATGSTSVSATVTRIRARTATAAGRTTVSGTLVRTRAVSATATGRTTVSAAVVRVRARSAVSTGSTAVSASLRRLRALGGTATGSTAVSASVARVRARSGTATGSTTVTATLVVTHPSPPPAPAGAGGTTWSPVRPRPLRLTGRLEVGVSCTATARVTGDAEEDLILLGVY